MSSPRILIIEDDASIATLVEEVAKQLHYEAYVLDDLRKLDRIYDNFAPHVIVLDILMPEMDGFEVMQYLHERGSDSRIIILSGAGGYRPMAGHMAQGLKLQVAATIAKPFRIPELREALRAIKLSLPPPYSLEEEVA